ncbi:MAG: hypothetical protein O7D86_00305 [Proteobacteria bacterium]|nr:hypothetical protein [Pseudomonadota bacterium]
MLLAKAPINGSSWMIADWLEFQVLCSEFNLYRLSDILRISDEDQDEENVNVGEQDALNEQCVERAVKEIEARISCLEVAYPFEISSDGKELVIKEELCDGAHAYIYCLFFSHVNRDDVLIPDPPHANQDRDLLQICSTIAAAGYISGNAVSFGYPRPNRDGFLTALKAAYERMGEGEVLVEIPAGLSDKVKDAGVDVIAWQDTLDGAAGKMYMLGQVASGHNWQDKSVKEDIRLLHENWFTNAPVSTPLPSMFIPFCLDIKTDETLEDVMLYKTREFGHMFYRYRLPLYVQKGMDLIGNTDYVLHIERIAEFDTVINYVNNFRQDVLIAGV